MSTVVIRPEGTDGQADSLKALLAAVYKVSGDEPVTLGFGGVVVSRAVAKKFLNAKTADPATDGHTADNTRAPLTTLHFDGTTGQQQHPDDSHNHPGDTVIGGRTPDGELPGGYAGVRADQRDTAPSTPEQSVSTGPAADRSGPAASPGSGGGPGEARKSTPAKTAAKSAPAKSTPAKKATAAAAQRASRSSAKE